MNFGLYFVESINFINYKNFIDGLVKVLIDEEKDLVLNVMRLKFWGIVIWKIIIVINKEKVSNVYFGYKCFLM